MLRTASHGLGHGKWNNKGRQIWIDSEDRENSV